MMNCDLRWMTSGGRIETWSDRCFGWDECLHRGILQTLYSMKSCKRRQILCTIRTLYISGLKLICTLDTSA